MKTIFLKVFNKANKGSVCGIMTLPLKQVRKEGRKSLKQPGAEAPHPSHHTPPRGRGEGPVAKGSIITALW